MFGDCIQNFRLKILFLDCVSKDEYFVMWEVYEKGRG